MAKRERITAEAQPTSPKANYFTADKPNIQFVSTGCTVLDCALGGGYPLGRIVNIVGDKSTAKTALATEALTNFLVTYDGEAAYRDCEAAFDTSYAEAMGLPINRVDFGSVDAPLGTVEDFERDLVAFTQRKKENGIYVLDSLDALSDEAEMGRDVGEGTYGANKAKQLSIMFRKNVRAIEASKTLVVVVSQVRDNIGAMFGEKHKRSGGRALDFYATQILWLAHIKTLKRTIRGAERAYGVEIKAKVKKNKISMPFREIDFEFHFGYGVEDILASANWLKEVKRLKDLGIKDDEYKEYLATVAAMDAVGYADERARVQKIVKTAWNEIEESFLPKRSKYATA